jgi:hypothetical protein
MGVILICCLIWSIFIRTAPEDLVCSRVSVSSGSADWERAISSIHVLNSMMQAKAVVAVLPVTTEERGLVLAYYRRLDARRGSLRVEDRGHPPANCEIASCAD